MRLAPTLVQDLLLATGTHPRGQPHISAASGLVRAGRWLYFVADDEHHLGVLPADVAGAPHPVLLHRIAEGDLPHNVEPAGLYEPLRAEFADLNIEGAFVASGHLHLLT